MTSAHSKEARFASFAEGVLTQANHSADPAKNTQVLGGETCAETAPMESRKVSGQIDSDEQNIAFLNLTIE
jgi:hypothetical protein